MLTFLEWLEASSGDYRGRLESAVREYMDSRPKYDRCYYVTRPKNMHFDPDNPKHVEDELGPDYDRSLGVVPFKHHPLSFTCLNVAGGLAEALKEKGFNARVVAGWYGHADRGYHAGHSPGLNDPHPPKGFGSNPQQHWWVEVGNYIVDLTSSQFHPATPDKQNDMTIRDKSNSLYDGSYATVRRFPLGRAVRLPPNATKMVDKILSMKKFSLGHSSVPSDNSELSEWILKNHNKFSVSLAAAQDVAAAIRGNTKPGFHFADRRMLERSFGEAFDDLEEDEELKRQDENPPEFKPAGRRASRGTLRYSRNRAVLSSTSPEEMTDNFEALERVFKKHFPSMEFGSRDKDSYRGRNGVVHLVSASISNTEGDWTSASHGDLLSDLKRDGFSVKYD